MVNLKLFSLNRFKLICYFILFINIFGVNCGLKAVSLTYGITVCTEAEELKRLLKQISANLDDEDMIIIQVDESNTTKDVDEVIKQFKKLLSDSQFYIIYKSLDGNFGEFKNNLLKYAGEKKGDFLFFLDADEYLSEPLAKSLKWYLYNYNDVDGLKLARANYYVNLDQYPEQKKALAGGIDSMGRFLYMDEKLRIVNLKNPKIKYCGRVHEEIEGCEKVLMLPYEPGNCWELIHVKTYEKQLKQNDLYSKIMK